MTERISDPVHCYLRSCFMQNYTYLLLLGIGPKLYSPSQVEIIGKYVVFFLTLARRVEEVRASANMSSNTSTSTPGHCNQTPVTITTTG